MSMLCTYYFTWLTLSNGVYLSEVETHASLKQLTCAHKMKQNVFDYHCVVQRNLKAGVLSCHTIFVTNLHIFKIQFENTKSLVIDSLWNFDNLLPLGFWVILDS